MKSPQWVETIFGKGLLDKRGYIISWFTYWVLLIVIMALGLAFLPEGRLWFMPIIAAFGFCQLIYRYMPTLGWRKLWCVLGFFPITNIIFFIVLLFIKQK